MAMPEDLWRECSAWLTRCKILAPDHKANWKKSEIRDLALTLRDGVLICNLLTFLDSTAIDPRDIHKKPQSAQFLCCHNIKLFLDACKNHFGLRESDLFEPTMLYALTDFLRVLLTLSKLSQCRKVQQLHPNLLGFNAQLSQNERSHSDEAIYRDLHSTTSDHSHTNGHAEDHDAKEEEVYQDLCAIQRASTRQQLTSSSTSFEQRDYVIRELVDTESNYLDVLNALRDKFMIPMEKDLTKDEIKIIFPRIPELAAIHVKFLEKLREAILPNTKLKLSQVFLEFREPFLIYGEYCSNVTNAIDTICDLCKNNSNVERLVLQCEKEYNVGKLQLRDILSVPMQRILKYHLLLDKLVKETIPGHDDFRGLERAKEAMVDVAQYINEVKRDSEHLAIIQKVKDSIVDLHLPHGNDLTEYGHLKLDGEFQIKAHDDQKTKNRYAFIFEKIMILVKILSAKTGETQYTFKDSLNLADYRVEFAHTRRTLGRDARFKCQLLLAHKSKKTAYTLYLKSETERNKWSKALNEAMDNLDPPGCRNTNHKFDITTFEVPVICRHCSKFLKGRIHQGYRCRVCDISVHKGCISSTGRCKQNPISLPPPVCDRQLSEYNWFAGPMDRYTATSKLEHCKVGTYLLRVRPQGALNWNETMYALSLKTEDNVIKHMKINQKQDGDVIIYCLSSRRHFRTIVALVSYYERNDLGENFAGLNQSLQWPYREITATAKYDFEPRGTNQLQLKEGCQVLIIGKDGDSKGWWRGKIGDTVGYFPKDYVQEHPPASEDISEQNEHL